MASALLKIFRPFGQGSPPPPLLFQLQRTVKSCHSDGMSVTSGPSASAAGRFRFSLARVCAVVFSVFSFMVMAGAYIDFCILPRIYAAQSQIEVVIPRDDASPDPIRAEIAFMYRPDVLAPIITDLSLNKIWAKRVYKSGLDVLPMQDALSYLNRILFISQVPGTHIISISVSSEVPQEAADIANAVADRYFTLRSGDEDRAFAEKEQILGDEIKQQQQVVAEKAAAVEAIRSQLQQQGIQIGPGAAGIIAADLATQKNGDQAQIDSFAPLRAAQTQLDTQQRALDDLLLRQRLDKADHQLSPNPVQVIARAGPPEYPIKPDHVLDLAGNIETSSFVAVIAAALLELLLWYLSRIAPYPPYVPQPAPNSAEY
jgi:uncharacterized protein involved in exopolysaccharide biosynthesis